MFDRMKKRLGFAGAAEPVRADPMPRTHLVPVPIIRPGNGVEIDRPEASMGYLDRNPDSTRQFVGATPVLRTADAEIRRAWGETTAHARHLFTQSGFLSGGIELACAWTVGGDGLQPSIKPDAYALGWSEAFAKTWANNVEARFKEWAHDPKACDAQGRQKFGAMQNAALKSYFGTGDILAVLDYGNKQGTAWKTSLSLIDPTRLWVPGVNVDRRVVIRDGVEFDDRGRPIAYHIRPLFE